MQKTVLAIALASVFSVGSVIASPHSAISNGIITEADKTLEGSIYGGGRFNQTGTYTANQTGVQLNNVKGNAIHIAGGALLIQEKDGSQVQLSYVGGSAENEKAGKLASSVSITNSTLTGTSFILGGGYVSGKSKANNFSSNTTIYGTSVNLDNVDAKDSFVVGGMRVYEGREATINVTNTKVTLTGNSSVKNVIGGSFIGGTRSQYAKMVETGSTHVYLGKDVQVSDYVIGGHYFNFHGTNGKVGETNVVIDGTKLGKETKVIAGNYLQFLGKPNASSQAAKIELNNSNLTITNGSEVGSVYGADYLVKGENNYKPASHVNNVNIAIEGSTIHGDVVGGTFIEGDQTDKATAHVDGNVSIVMSDTTVAGTITSDNMVKDQIVANNSSSSVIDLTNVVAKKVVASKGAIHLSAEGDSTTHIEALDIEDDVKVSFFADGEANDASGGDIKNAIVIGNDNYNGTVEMEEGMYFGAVSGTIKDGVANVTQETNTVMANVLDLASASSLFINRILMNDVRKRLGDLRESQGTHGVWARYDGGKASGNHNLKNEFTTFQAGIDTVPEANAPRFGLAFSYTTADADLNRGSADTDAFSLAFYGTKFYDNGLFWDVIGRMAKVGTDVTVENKKGTLDNVALSLSGELGWRLDLNKQLYIEPQSEITYTYIDADKLDLSGYTYDFDTVNSFIGRLGFATGVKCPDNFGDLYFRVSALHEFAGDASVKGGQSAVHKRDGKDTWVEFGVGGNFNINDTTYVYGDVERTSGAALDTDWRMTVGVRHAF